MELKSHAVMPVYSAIHKAIGRCSSQLELPPGAVPAASSIHSLWEFQELYQANHAMAGGFVNSAVT